MDPAGSGLGSGVFTADMPFYIREGFVNTGDEPLGAGFDVAVYVTQLSAPGEHGGRSMGETYRYTSDYVIRGTSEACGPTYETQTGPVTCEWFVHEFKDGLPGGPACNVGGVGGTMLGVARLRLHRQLCRPGRDHVAVLLRLRRTIPVLPARLPAT